MKRKHWVLAISVAALLAAAVTWQQRRDRGVASAPRAVGATPRQAVPTPIDEPEMRSGPPQVLADDDPIGELRLEGQVLDSSDQPVADAVISLASNPPRQARSGVDGAFVFDRLLARPYTVTARAPAGVAGPVTARLGATSDPVVLRLRAGAQLLIEVIDPQRRPVDGATIELRGVDTQSVKSKAGQASLAPVVPGLYQVVAWADGYARSFVPTLIGAGTTSLRIELALGAPVTGRVVDELGAGVAEARVRFESTSDFAPVMQVHRDAVASTGDGTFTFSALPAGSIRFIASQGDFATGVSAMVTLDGRTPKSGIEIMLPAGAALRGKVVSSDGRPVDSARVRVGVSGSGFRTVVPPREAYSDAAGEFVVRGLPRRALTALALHELGASKAQTVDTSAGDVAGLVLTLDATGTIDGIVVDASGQPIDGAQVSAFPDFMSAGKPSPEGATAPRVDFSQWQLRGFPQELTDANGHFRLTGLAPGGYRVRATRSAAVSRGRGLSSDGVAAVAGTSHLRLVLPAEGAVKGKVAFDDGGAPDRFTVAVGFAQQSFTGGAFVLDELTPQSYQLVVRGAAFQTRILDVVIAPAKTLDLGTVLVSKGRELAGVVVAEGKPVPGAKVIAGSQLMGSGTSSSASVGPAMRGIKEITTAEDGTFVLDGFGDRDLTVVAEHATLGRSKAQTTIAQPRGQARLTLTLLPFGAVRGAVQQAGKASEGVMITAQSIASPGSLYSVMSGPDGGYRFDRLAPDRYKVSATVGLPMTGMRQYSRPVDVVSGKESVVDLAVEPGLVALELRVAAQGGSGAPSEGPSVRLVSWAVVQGAIEASTAKQLRVRMAAAPPGASQFGIGASPLRVSEMAPGSYTICIVAYPVELPDVMRVFTYSERHGDQLAATCKPVAVAAAPALQGVDLAVVVPALISDDPASPGGAETPPRDPP